MHAKGLLKLCVPIVGVWLMFSCSDDFLSVTETTNLYQDSVFQDSARVERFLAQIYVDVGFDVKRDRYSGHGGLQTASDEAAYKANTGGATDIYFVMGNITPMTTAEDDVWRIAYRNIRRVNVLFAHIDECVGTEGMNDKRKAESKAEARFLRAWYYAMLVRTYGGVPLVYDDIYDSVEEARKARNTYEECVDYICEQAEEAAKDLPASWSGNWYGRATKGACYALISRVRLYAASPLFNGSDFAPAGYPEGIVGYPTADPERWKIAADAALDVIDPTRHTTDYRPAQYDLFIRNQDQNNRDFPGWGWYATSLASDYYNNYPEVYSSIIFWRKDGGGVGTQQAFFPPNAGGNGTNGYLYHDLVEAYPMKDGGYGVGQTPKEYSTEDGWGYREIDTQIYKTSQYTYDPLLPLETLSTDVDPSGERSTVKDRDPRLQFMAVFDGATMFRDADVKYTVDTSVGSGQDAVYRGTPTGYYVRKFTAIHANGQNIMTGACSQARPLLRYTEVLLNYAEAANEYYGPSHEENVAGMVISPLAVLKKIREAAGIDAGDDGNYGLNADYLLSNKDAMRLAIHMERRLELAFEGHRFYDVRRWMLYGNPTSSISWMMRGFEVTKDAATGTRTGRIFDARQHVFRNAMYLYPIPYKETVKSPDLVQNPYYEQ